jgi:hypothetical protein
MAVPSTRHIASGGLARDGLLTRDETRHNLDLDICESLFLCLGKLAHIVMSEADVIASASEKDC